MTVPGCQVSRATNAVVPSARLGLFCRQPARGEPSADVRAEYRFPVVEPSAQYRGRIPWTRLSDQLFSRSSVAGRPCAFVPTEVWSRWASDVADNDRSRAGVAGGLLDKVGRDQDPTAIAGQSGQ